MGIRGLFQHHPSQQGLTDRNLLDAGLEKVAPLSSIHSAAGGQAFEARDSIASTFWRSSGLLSKPQAYEALVPEGLHLGCGIARIRTEAVGIGGFTTDGPGITALTCVGQGRFRTEVLPGRTMSCGLWLTPDQLVGASGDLARLAAFLGNQPALRSSTSVPARVVSRLCAPIDPWFQGAARELATEARALELLAAVITWLLQKSTHPSPKLPRRQVVLARDLIESSLVDPPTLGVIARSVGLNERTLTTAFRQAFGMSIAAYVTARRLDLAASLLSEGASPGEAARQVGYRPTHLAAAFKRRFGVSPGVYRRK